MTQVKSKYDIISAIHDLQINVEKREIFLDSIKDNENDADEIDYRTATTFLKNFRYLESLSITSPIIIHINTCGGDWFHGMAIYDIIQTSPCYVYIIGHGRVCSMGTVIMQAADIRILMPNSLFLIHEGSESHSGTFKQVTSAMEHANHSVYPKMLDIYTEKCVDGEFFKDKTKTQVKKYIKSKFNAKEDWYMNPSEALNYGFIDNILGDKKFANLNSVFGV